jgi:hypothetical protein
MKISHPLTGFHPHIGDVAACLLLYWRFPETGECQRRAIKPCFYYPQSPMSISTSSTTTRLDPVVLRLISRDYAVHQTGDDGSQPEEEARADIIIPQPTVAGIDPTTEPHPRVPGHTNPIWWPSAQYRRVPDYAPINHELNREVRPIGMNPVISVLLSMTFSGCSLLSVSRRI